jgi:coproporphyrinogen III oxidase-like Fe-S oxidoreductase
MKDFYAFGMGATSLLSDYRFSRPNNISKYYRYIAEIEKDGVDSYYENNLQKEINFDKLELYMMGKLRTNEGLDLKAIPINIAKLIKSFFNQNKDTYE